MSLRQRVAEKDIHRQLPDELPHQLLAFPFLQIYRNCFFADIRGDVVGVQILDAGILADVAVRIARARAGRARRLDPDHPPAELYEPLRRVRQSQRLFEGEDYSFSHFNAQQSPCESSLRAS